MTFVPSIQIQYTWQKGKPIAQYEHGLVKELDGVLDQMIAARAPLPSPGHDGDEPTPGSPVREGPSLSQGVHAGALALDPGDANAMPVLSPPEVNVPAAITSDRVRFADRIVDCIVSTASCT